MEFNEVARQMYATAGVSADSLIGKHAIDDAFPDSRDLPTSRTMIRALTERVFTEAESFYPPWGVWFAVRHFPTADGGVTTVFEDITARKLTEEGLRRATEATDIFSWEVDVAAGTLVWSANAHAVLGISRESLPETLADAFALVHPDDLVAMQNVMQAANARGDNFEMEARLVHPRTRELVWVSSQGSAVKNVASGTGSTRYFGISQNITERKERERQQGFLLTLSDALRAEANADDVVNRALRMLFEHLNLDRCYVGVYRLAEDRGEFTHQVGNDRVPPMPDGVRLSDFPEAFRTALDRTLVIDDVAETEGLAETDRRNLVALGLRALVSATLRKGANNPLWAIVAVSASPRRWTRGEIGLLEEVTERTWAAMERARAEAALRGSEARFRAAVSAVSSLIWTANARGEMEGEQPGWSGFTGQTRGELQGYGWAQAVHPDDAQPTLDAWKQAVSEKRMFEFEHRIRRHDGVWRACSVRAVPVNETGEVREWVGVHNDITERKQAQDAQRLTNERLTLAVKCSQVVLFQQDLELRFTWLHNPAPGIDGSDPVGKREADLLERAEDVAVIEGLKREVIRSGVGMRQEFFPHIQGVGHCFEVLMEPLRDAEGRITGITGAAIDITARKQADGRLRRLIDSNMQGVIFWNKQGEITEANDAFLRLVGYTRDDLAAGLISWAAITPPEYAHLDRHALEEIAATGACTPIEKEYIRKDGTRVPILVGGASLDDNANEGVSFVLDITTLKDAETALLAAHQQQRALSRRLLEVQETERRKIARDLHDELGQVLTAVKINLQTVQPAADGPLAPSVALVDRALQQARSLSLALRPPLLDDLGLVPALRWLVDAQARQAGCRITLAAEPLPDRPGPAVETACFRIAQEAVTNAQRHARATLIAVELRLVGDGLQLTVRDDGTGFDLVAVRTRALRGDSFGVLGMEERATLAGARIGWDSAAGRGTTVQATFPLSPALAGDKDPTA